MKQDVWEADTKALHIRCVCFLFIVMSSCCRTEHASSICFSGVQESGNCIASLCFSGLQGKAVNNGIWPMTFCPLTQYSRKRKQLFLFFLSPAPSLFQSSLYSFSELSSGILSILSYLCNDVFLL